MEYFDFYLSFQIIMFIIAAPLAVTLGRYFLKKRVSKSQIDIAHDLSAAPGYKFLEYFATLPADEQIPLAFYRVVQRCWPGKGFGSFLDKKWISLGALLLFPKYLVFLRTGFIANGEKIISQYKDNQKEVPAICRAIARTSPQLSAEDVYHGLADLNSLFIPTHSLNDLFFSKHGFKTNYLFNYKAAIIGFKWQHEKNILSFLDERKSLSFSGKQSPDSIESAEEFFLVLQQTINKLKLSAE